MLVSLAVPGGNAEEAGIRGGDRSEYVAFGGLTVYLGGDIIVGINDSEVRTIQDFYAALEPTNPGDLISVTLLQDGKEKTVDVTLSERPPRTGW